MNKNDHPETLARARFEAAKTSGLSVSIELPDLNAAVRARTVKDSAMEAKACALLKQYGFFIRGPVKEFFHELADFLNWQHLKKDLK
jgi:hypothetical protein